MKKYFSFDFLVAILTIPIAIILIVVEYTTFRPNIRQVVGPHVWPIGLLSLLIVTAVILFVQTSSSKKKPSPSEHASLTPAPSNWYKKPHIAVVMIIAGLMIYGLLLKPLGFVISTFLLIIYQARIIQSGRWVRNTLAGAAFSLGVYFVFVKFLNVMLPAGLLGW